jgi:hypothetical protein
VNGWDLPEVVTVDGTPYRVNTDFRDVLDIIDHLTDPNDSEMERWYIAMALFYEDFASIPEGDYSEAMTKLAEFIEGGQLPPQNRKPPRRLMDWQQDASMIASGVKQGGRVRRAQPAVPALVHFPGLFFRRWGGTALDCGQHPK